MLGSRAPPPLRKADVNNNNPEDFVGLLIALISMITGREMAALLGPYAAIIVLAVGGAMVALNGHEDEMTAWQAARYVLVRVVLAVGLTVSLAELLTGWVPWAKPRYTLIPLAFAIGYIRDYQAAIKFIWEKIASLLPTGANNAK